MNLNNENSLFYKISKVIFSGALIILVCIHIFNYYNGQEDKFLFSLMLVCAGIYTLLNSLLQLKCKQNILGFVLFLLCGVFSIILGVSFMCK
ncbi:hypothetical protein KPL37_12270 [Clostridium frigoris]|uniref:DUF3953 domain-containing protein n=1 Tax=Clostridium frigoris TaxID=205327 RepID=A0ABS6BUC2_9CLOT|nr:hypothetical protein [Clostridium frigoris]MBU3160520.1 hypothetical protein [Clostridium frigoris]